MLLLFKMVEFGMKWYGIVMNIGRVSLKEEWVTLQNCVERIMNQERIPEHGSL